MSKYLSTGVSLYNLQLTGDTKKGIKEGSYAFVVGDSSAGKSCLAATIAAERSSHDPLKGRRMAIFQFVKTLRSIYSIVHVYPLEQPLMALPSLSKRIRRPSCMWAGPQL